MAAVEHGVRTPLTDTEVTTQNSLAHWAHHLPGTLCFSLEGARLEILSLPIISM